jgi:hypothetical protein
MGKVSNGILGAVRGKVNNLVFYPLNGQELVRVVGTKKTIRSDAVKAQNNSMALLMSFFSKINVYLRAGFKNEAKSTIYNYHNLATSYNKINAISIIDNLPQIDYSKILLSRGTALPANDPRVELAAEGLHFEWETDENIPWIANQDQAMLMAYFPEINEAIFNLAGAKRIEGSDVLNLPSAFRDLRMETYLSFVSVDRESVSNSTYLPWT